MFRIVIAIYRGTSAGRALQLMASGLIVSHESYAEAEKEYDRYMDCASAVLESVDKGQAFGVITIVNASGPYIAKTELIQRN